jgi:acetyltransferase
VYIGHEALIFGANGSNIIIEDYAKIGSRVVLVTGSHLFTTEGPCIEGEGIFKDVKIGKGAAVSTGSTILPGKTIGEMAHVAAGSVVTHDVPSYHRVAGVPAKVIKDLRIK